MNVPDLLRTIAPRERILVALRPGPLTMRTLCAQVGSTSQRIWKVLDELHRAGVVKRLGARSASTWALAAQSGHVPQRPLAVTIKPRRAPVSAHVPPAGSWWLTVSRDEFQAVARARASLHGRTDD